MYNQIFNFTYSRVRYHCTNIILYYNTICYVQKQIKKLLPHTAHETILIDFLYSFYRTPRMV